MIQTVVKRDGRIVGFNEQKIMAAIRKAKKALRKAFEASMAGKGSSLVEFVSTCSSGWKLTPKQANKWMQENMFKFYPKGDLKDTTGE